MRILFQAKFYLFALLFVFSCTVYNPIQDYQKNNNKIRSETPKSFQHNQRDLKEQDLVNKTDPLHCTELYGCYSEEENDPLFHHQTGQGDWTENLNNLYCSKQYGCYSEENDPQNKIIKDIHNKIDQNISQRVENELKVLQFKIDESKKHCEELGFKKGTEKFGDCVLKLSE